MKVNAFQVVGGIGNIVQAMPAVKAIASEGNVIDLLLCCNSSTDVAIFRTDYVRDVYIRGETPKGTYEKQLEGNLFLKRGESIPKMAPKVRSRVRYSRHHPEAEYYYDIVEQMGVTTPMEDARINFGENGPKPEHADTVAIYCGSKPNWSMKRWNKYDDLAKNFKHVTLVGTRADIHSQGNPAWIKRKWNWPKHVETFIGSLQDAAHFIAHCKMFIGNDGGLAHVAAATGIPSFILFGPSSVEKNKPYSSKAKAIAIDLPCRPCQYRDGQQYLLPGKSNCPHDMKCMRDMHTQFVLDQINREIS